MLVSLLAVSGVAGLYFGVIRTGIGQSLDQAAYDGRISVGSKAAIQARQMLGIISTGSLAVAIVVVATVAAIQGRWRLAVLAIGVIGSAVLATEFLKLIALERPDLGVSPGAANSYPSGHATICMAIGLGLLLVVPDPLRIPTGIFAIALGAAAGTAVVAVGWHRPSDVIGSNLVSLAAAAGFFGLFLTIFPDELRQDRAGEDAAEARRSADRLEIGAALVTILGLIAVAAFALARHRDGIRLTDDLNRFVFTAIALTLSSSLSVFALSWARARRV